MPRRPTLKPIIPKKPPTNTTKMTRAVLDAIDQETAAIQDDLHKTTRTWKTKVSFRILKAHSEGDTLVGASGTDNAIYGYVTRGTRPHIIRPRRARALRFQGGYSAKTRRGLIGSATGGSFGATVFSQGVQHPGNEAREFEEQIAGLHQKSFVRRVQENIEKATKE